MTVYFSKGVQTGNMTFARDRAQKSDFDTLVGLAKNPTPVKTSTLQAYKKSQATYMLAGTLDPAKRSDENFKATSLLFIDFDHIPNENQFIISVQLKLCEYQYILYPSISYGQVDENGKPKGARYHLVLNLSHPLQQEDGGSKLTKAPLTAYVCALLGMKSDPAMNTWSQPFGAPTVTDKNAGKTAINTNGKPLDVDKVIANYKPATKAPAVVTGKSQAPAVAQKRARLLPDSYVHELLTQWTYEHPDEVATEEKFSTYLIYVLNAQRAGEISSEALNDAMTVFAQGNTDWTAGNVQKLAEHQHSSEKPNKSSFRERFKTSVPVYLRAPEDATYTMQSVELALVKAGKAKREKSKNGTLTAADIADIIVECIPMWARWKDTPDKSFPLIEIYKPSTGIYSSSQALFNHYVSLVDRDAASNKLKDVYSKLLDPARVRDTKGLESGDMIATSNLIIDLSHEKAVFHQFSPRYHFTSKIATEFHDIHDKAIPTYKTRTGETITPVSLLQTICSGEPSKVKQLLEVLGDACQPLKTRNQATWLLGKQNSTRENGSNGKSTFLDMVQAVVSAGNVATLKLTDMDGQFAMEQVVGKSVIIGDDVPAGAYIRDSGNFNNLVTGDMIRIEAKGKDAYSYRSQAGVIQSANQLPKFANQTGGTNRRMHIIVFDAHIPANKADVTIRSQFIPSKEFREFLLYLAVAAVKGNSQFTETAESRAAVEEFAKGNDTVNLFVDEVASQWKSKRVPTQWAFDEYIKFVQDNKFEHSKSKPAFVKAMTGGLGYTELKRSSVSSKNFHEYKTWVALRHGDSGISCLQCPTQTQAVAQTA